MMPRFYFGEQLSEFFLDHIKPHLYFDRWSIQPFNGQSKRMSIIWEISRKFDPTLGIETGTFLGSSTPYLASMVSGDMYTIEIEEKTAQLARERFEKNHKNSKIKLVVGDSVKEISNILKSVNPNEERILAYLDAHWYTAVPTTSEIDELIKWGGSWIAVIDDFKVPNDDGYKFDVYGAIEISKEILPDSERLCLYVPRISSDQETGRRKGTGFVCQKNDEEIFSNLKDLQKVDLR
jgi:hypothetical protein